MALLQSLWEMVGVDCRGMQVGGGVSQIYPNKWLPGQREGESHPSVPTYKGLMGAEGPTNPHPNPVLVSAAEDPRGSFQGEQRPPGTARALESTHMGRHLVRDGAKGQGHIPWLGRPRW